MNLVGRLGLEPRTCGLRVRCSTIELTAHTLKLGWIMGFEPTTLGITIRCSNQLSYTHHCTKLVPVARPTGLEPATAGLEGRCSIRLSYGRSFRIVASNPLSRRWRRNGRGRGIRTPDILLPKQARYQTALYPAGSDRVRIQTITEAAACYASRTAPSTKPPDFRRATFRFQTKRGAFAPRFVSTMLARPERFELPTTKFVAWYSIQLSYGRKQGAEL